MKKVIFAFLLLASISSSAQKLRQGMNHEELVEAFLVNSVTCAIDESELTGKNYVAPPEKFKRVYRSEELGLSNLWEFWLSPDSIAIISIRGTVESESSVAEDFFAAMAPAKGKIIIAGSDTIHYKLAEHPRASVHAGFLVGSLFLNKEITPMVKDYTKRGYKDFIIVGHSQGGAITYMITSILRHLQVDGDLPADVRFKTYGVAAPKPGNLFYAYDYEMLTQGGWAYNVVNAHDWVPQVPISLQTLADFSEANPFTDGKLLLKKLKFPANLFSESIYNKFDRPSKKAAKNYEKFLGEKYKFVLKQLKVEIELAEFAKNNNYQRTGNTWVIEPTKDYFEKFPKGDVTKYFPYHLHREYLYLMDPTKIVEPK